MEPSTNVARTKSKIYISNVLRNVRYVRPVRRSKNGPRAPTDCERTFLSDCRASSIFLKTLDKELQVIGLRLSVRIQ